MECARSLDPGTAVARMFLASLSGTGRSLVVSMYRRRKACFWFIWKSRRTGTWYSSVLVGVPHNTLPQSSMGVGSLAAMLSAAGLRLDGAILLFTKPPPSVSCRPLLHAGEANARRRLRE